MFRLTQAVVAPVHIAPFDFRLRFQLLHEMTMPVQAADEGLQALALACAVVWQALQLAVGGLHDFAQAQATHGQIRGKAGAGSGSGQWRGNTAAILRAALLQEVL